MANFFYSIFNSIFKRETNIQENNEKIHEQILNEQIINDQIINEKILNEQIQNEQIKKEQMEYEKIRYERIRNERIRNEQIRNQQIRNEQIRNEQIRNEQIRNEQIRNEQIRNEQIRNEQIRNEQIRNEQIRNEQIRNEQIRNDQIRNEQIRNEQIRNEQIRNELELICSKDIEKANFLQKSIYKKINYRELIDTTGMRGAGIFIFSKDCSKFLLILDDRSLKWSIPKGCFETNETIFQTAVRETYEETKLIYNKDYHLLDPNAYKIASYYVFIAKVVDNFNKILTPNINEHVKQIEWFDNINFTRKDYNLVTYNVLQEYSLYLSTS
jgi:hypothetical protein